MVCDDHRWTILSNKLKSDRLATLSLQLKEFGIDFLLLKGWCVARYYPPQSPRRYGDFDIAVSSQVYEYVSDIKLKEPPPLSDVDLHCGLRHLDALPWEIVYSRSEAVMISGQVIRIPCPEDHLRIVSTHWLNDGGVNKERLWDIYYSVINRPKDFDWSKCLDCVNETRRGWVITAIGLAHRYLGLNIDDLPFKDEALQIPVWVIETLEREWAIREPIRPLETCTADPLLFLRQLKRRIPPNPILATIKMGEPIDDRGRAMIQVRNFMRRVGPSIRRVSSVLRRRLKLTSDD